MSQSNLNNTNSNGEYTPIKKAVRDLKRSLPADFDQHLSYHPNKRARMNIPSNNQIEFIIGNEPNTKTFYISHDLIKNESSELFNLNNNNRIYIPTMKASIFNKIKSFIENQNQNQLITSCEAVHIYIFANIYKMNNLLDYSQNKFNLINISTINDWYSIINTFNKLNKNNYLHSHNLLCEFIEKYSQNKFLSFDIMNDIRFYELSIDLIQTYVEYAHFNDEYIKFLFIFQYCQHRYHDHNHNNIRDVANMISDYFIDLIDLNESSLLNLIISNKNQRNLNKNCNELLFDYISFATTNVGLNINNLLILNKKQANSNAVNIDLNKENIQKLSLKSSKNQNNNKISSINTKRKTYTKIITSPNDVRKLLNSYGFVEPVFVVSTVCGQVWRATARKRCNFNKIVIKMINKTHNASLLNEVLILRKLNKLDLDSNSADSDCNIIKLIDVIDNSSLAFYSMIILEDGGNDLFNFTKESHHKIIHNIINISFWRNIVKLIIKKLTNLIFWLHENVKLCHLDISLENILISNINNDLTHFKLKLIDFGLSKLFNNNNFECKSVIGKPAYCSPEIYKLYCNNNGSSFDARKSDIWSFGICIFQLIIGCRPWERPDEINDKRFQKIVLNHDIDFILKRWNRLHYIDKDIKHLLNNIFVLNENKRISIKGIQNEIKEWI